MTTPEPSKLLRRALRMNGAFSTVSAVLFIAAAGPLTAWIGLNSRLWLIATGISLLVFAVGLFLIAARATLSVPEAGAAVALDVGWVLGSVVLLELGLFTAGGSVAVGALAAVVLSFAVMQFLGLRQLRPR